MTTLTVGDLAFAVRRSSRRKTLEITVERDGALAISAPPQVKDAVLRAFVREKQFWIYTKLAEKDRLRRAVPQKEYVDGEGFAYLGRSYRLKVVEDQDAPLKLAAGRFRLDRTALPAAHVHFVDWYERSAQTWLARRVREWQERMRVDVHAVRVQGLGYRWGSCGAGGVLYFHWKTILLPPAIAEYVVVHEMAHLHEPHHTPAFWRRVQDALPDCALRKEWLAENGAGVEGV